VNTLLDSHALLWALHDPKRMRKEAVAALRDDSTTVFYSAASAWELELKAARGKLSLPNGWLEAAESAGFIHVAVTAASARASARLPWHHADPFDRMLVAQAAELGCRIATRDPLLRPYGIALLEV